MYFFLKLFEVLIQVNNKLVEENNLFVEATNILLSASEHIFEMILRLF